MSEIIKSVLYTEDDAGKNILLLKGGEAVIALVEDHSKNMKWVARETPAGWVKNDEAKKAIAGSTKTQIREFRFDVNTTGQVIFDYLNPWSKDKTPQKTVDFEITTVDHF